MNPEERDSDRDSLSQVLPNTSKSVQIQMANPSAGQEDPVLDLEKNTTTTTTTTTTDHGGANERSKWLLDCPAPPSPWLELKTQVRNTFVPRAKRFKSLRNKPIPERVFCILKAVFPILGWCRNYKASMFKNDLMAVLTLASLCIPQSIGYATLAKLDPQYGLYSSVVPPLIYAFMGTSREIAIGPVAVVSLLISSMLQKLTDPETDPIGYRKLVLTATFFAGVFQASFGLFRLGFLVDFLSHAAIVGFMAGAAIVIGLQQLKGLLGISNFTTKTVKITPHSIIIIVVSTIRISPLVFFFVCFLLQWSPHTFILGCSFLIFILLARFIGKKNKKLFWIPAIAPLVSVIVATFMVFITKADEHGVKTVRHIKGGLNPISMHDLEFTNPHIGEVAKIGLIVAVVALTEAIAVGRSFAGIKGYRLDGNKEMVAIGFMNVLGSFTSCYTATGSFSRTAVNFAAGSETAMSNIVMAVTVLVVLQCLTRLLYYTPIAILASVILSALPGLIDLNEAYRIWKLDKFDFLSCIGAFFGVLFASVEIGLLVAVAISFAKIILVSIRPGIETLGRMPGTNIFADTDQYPMAVKIPGVFIVRVKSALLCFANANFIRERYIYIHTHRRGEEDKKGNMQKNILLVALDMSNLINIDTSGIEALVELHNNLTKYGVELAIVNPKWEVIHKLSQAKFVSRIGGKVYVTIGEALDACIGLKV
ncbi:PREDICTED: sulfate transporter 2.1-like [Tarenaya hassleriana]|uniref:sulfate transporter 2.1-like n=2 Tax=Tarenaya hassleriana TaxID=28532 RepID=UPI00053C291F|nr:PREDICTED: sulfate transporter 2.1-like [Tarenaya hassleriana]